MEKVRNWFANNAVTVLLGLPTIGSFVATIRKFFSRQTISPLEIILTVSLLVILIILICKGIWDAFSYKSYHYPWSKVRTMYNYKVLKKTITYERLSDDRVNYKRTLQIKSFANRLESISDKYIWTGSAEGAIVIKPDKDASGKKEVKKISPKTKIGIWNYFTVEFCNHMIKGDTRTLAYKWPTFSHCKDSSPFISASTDELTKSLIMRLTLGKEYANQEIICEEFRAIESDYQISSVVHHLDEHGSFEWNVPRVKRFRHYRMRWSWEIGQSAAEIDE